MGKAEFDVKRGHWKTIEGEKLRELAEVHFGQAVEKDGWVVADFMGYLTVRAQLEGKDTLHVENEYADDIPQTAFEPLRAAWNNFLEEATGFDAKKRGKRAQKKAKEQAKKEAEAQAN